MSGGDPRRFESIYAALDAHRPDVFVVQDFSRWTRDDPAHFWVMWVQMQDRGVRIVSTDPSEQTAPDVPFFQTITTMKVEMNHQERLRLKAKTSAGVKAAWANGKRWGSPFGWEWNGRGYDIDREKVVAFYTAYAEGEDIMTIARRYGLRVSNVRRMIGAKSQRDIVGEALWARAMERRRLRVRAQRGDAQVPNVYRGLLRCPFCGGTYNQKGASKFGHYRCDNRVAVPHPFSIVNARTVHPVIREFLSRLVSPEDLNAAVAPPPPDPRRPAEEIAAELSKLTEAWIKGRIAQARYEQMAAALEAERDAPPPLPVPEQVKLRYSLWLEAEHLGTKDPEIGAAVNRVLRAALSEIRITEDRSVLPLLRPEYRHWYTDEAGAHTVRAVQWRQPPHDGTPNPLGVLH